MARKDGKVNRAFNIFAAIAALFLIFVDFSALAQETKDGLVYLRPVAAVASSFDESEWAPPQDAMAAADGDFETRWSPSLGKDNEWTYFDLGKPKTLTRIVIYWERAYAREYEILTSDDATQWRSAVLMKDRHGGIETIDLPPTTARYVKLIGLKRSNPEWGFSIWEFEIYGPKEFNPEDKPIQEVFPNRKPREVIKLVMEEPLTSSGKISAKEFQKGISYSSYSESDLAAKESDAMLEYLKGLNITHVSLSVTWYQDTLESDKMYPEDPQSGRTPNDEALSHVINKAHALGLKVVLKPHLDVQAGDFRGNIPGDEEWFKNYEEFILRYAKFAAKYNVEMFCIGTELGGTPLKWEQDWRKLIKDVRSVYKGPLVYAANWDEYTEVPFWNELDFMGIDAYFPLTAKNDPSKDELIAGWEKRAGEIENFLKKKNINKPVIFTEVGYTSANGTNRKPWEAPSQVEDQKDQAECLDAAMTVLTRKSWFRGLYWWNAFPQETDNPLGFTVKGKLAEGVLAGWYKKAK